MYWSIKKRLNQYLFSLLFHTWINAFNWLIQTSFVFCSVVLWLASVIKHFAIKVNVRHVFASGWSWTRSNCLGEIIAGQIHLKNMNPLILGLVHFTFFIFAFYLTQVYLATWWCLSSVSFSKSNFFTIADFKCPNIRRNSLQRACLVYFLAISPVILTWDILSLLFEFRSKWFEHV